MVDQKLVDTYNFLDRHAVFAQKPGEGEMEAMLRVLAMPPEEVWKRREAMAKMARKMNKRTAKFVAKWVAEVAPLAPAVPPVVDTKPVAPSSKALKEAAKRRRKRRRRLGHQSTEHP